MSAWTSLITEWDMRATNEPRWELDVRRHERTTLPDGTEMLTITGELWLNGSALLPEISIVTREDDLWDVPRYQGDPDGLLILVRLTV